MNLFIILIALLLIAAVIMHFTAKREECHNAKAPAEGAEAPPTIEEAAAAEIAAMTPAKAPKGITEEEILEKVAVGLTRDQAIEVIKNQQAHDAALAKSEKKAK